MAVCSCSLSRIVVSITVLLVAYWIINMYNLTVTTRCREKSNSNCIKPVYLMKRKMQLMVYVSTQEKSSWMTQHKLIFNETNFMRNETISRELNVTIPQSTLNNGTLYVHIFVGPQNKSPEKISNHDKFTIITAPLTKYLIPSAAEFNLVTGEYESTVINTSSSPVSHWIPVLDILGVGEDWYFERHLLPYELLFISRSIKVVKGTLTYLPIIKCDHMNVLNRHLQRITVDNTTLPVTITYSPVGLGQLRVWTQFQQAMKVMSKLGFPEKELDTVRELVFGTNYYLLMLTFFVSSFHLLFDFLAFKNDISFWRKRKTTYGLSRRTVLWRCFSYSVVFLYLMEEKTSLLILVPEGISTVIEYWKLWKVLKVKVKWIHRLPRLEFGQQLASEQQTDSYDSQAMKLLSYILIPLVIGGAIYSLMYLSYKSIYSWIVHSLVNGVYAFGFLFMLPQLFVNYKLKSVSHLPWRAFMYKAFNTFIDDVFAFIITMPTSHRVAVFRDDLIFLIYLYQRWLYPVDKKRVNEYGESFDDTGLEKKQN